MEIFGKDVCLRSHYCQLFDNECEEVKEPYVNIYVRFKGCNAKCKFCEFSNDASYFDEVKFAKVLSELNSKLKINKIAFTGGEPTLNYEKFKAIVDIAESISPESFFVLNSNGFNINRVLTDNIRIDNISLSRHHYSDKLNNEILGFESISNEEIKEYNKSIPDLIHLSCNLIKGYIDSKSSAYTYLEKASKINATSVGFISLMPINQYCIDNFIDFKDLNLESKRFNLTKEWKYKDMCRCHNYFYIPKGLNPLIFVYMKNTFKPFDITTSLVYDGYNLKQGYGNDVIC